ncbi:hypothetical protein DXG03_002426 [Asterophora parasitica]|uniref:EH domain-containing protein n=1 Tax=Asterophora parasitica TaxID=117018 RepID=A0A9P7GBX6_9AGAR|nr:hypothetical protein DXG03_002426 [Asterophora parasitica]
MLTGFSPSEDELELVAQIYDQAGTSRPGVINGETAVEILEASVDLPQTVLSAAWDIADAKKAGYLSERGLAMALRLIGWAQSGEEVSADLVNKLDAAQGVFEMLDLAPSDLWQTWDIADTRKRGALDRTEFALAMYLMHCFKSGNLDQIPLHTPTQIYEQIVAAFESAPSSPPCAPDTPSTISEVRPQHTTRRPSRPPPPTPTSAKPKVNLSSPHAISPSPSNPRKSISASFSATSSPPEKLPPSLARVSSTKSHHAPRSPPSPPANSNKPSPKLDFPTLSRATSSGKINFLLPSISRNFSGRSHPASPVSPETLFRSSWSPSHFDVDVGWEINPVAKATADYHFDSLDPEKTGFVEGDVAAKFMLGYDLRSEDLAHIWNLADLYSNNRLTRECFAIAIHFIQAKLNGAELPQVLPDFLIPPSLRTQMPNTELHRKASTLSHPQKKWSRPPPLPPKPASRRLSVAQSPATPPGAYSPTVSLITLTFFEVETNGVANLPDAMPHVPEAPPVDLEQYRNIQQENAFLTSKVEDLTAQIVAHRDAQAASIKLTRENKSLVAKINDMEQITSELLQANEARPAMDDLTQEIQSLTRSLAESENVQSRLDEVTGRLDRTALENRDLSARLRDVREAAETASRRSQSEVVDLNREIENLQRQNADLLAASREIERSVSQRRSNEPTNVQELEILLGSATRENEGLKERLRRIQRSTTQILMSSNGHAAQEELRRENLGLKAQIEELDQLTKELQRSSEEGELQRVMRDITHENEALKTDLRGLRGEVGQMRAERRAAAEPLQREVEELKAEVRRLRGELSEARRQAVRAAHPEDDPSIPPPAYDEGPFA